MMCCLTERNSKKSTAVPVPMTNSHTLIPYTEFNKTPTTYAENTNINVKGGVTATIFGELVRPNGITGKSIPNLAFGQGYKQSVVPVDHSFRG